MNSRAARAAALVLLVGVSLWEGAQSRQSVAARASVALAVVGMLAAAVVLGRGRQRRSSGAWVVASARALRDGPAARTAGVLVWAGLAAAVVAWDLYSFVSQAHDLPTLSRLFGTISSHRVGRGALFAAWLALGVLLATAARRGRGRAQDR